MPHRHDDIEAKLPDVTTIPLDALAALSTEQLSEALRLVVSRALSDAEIQVQVQDDWPPEESEPRR
ncbi:hypothetical protein F4560_001410 [Saccharothrix ecbatanensis]|uniref:FXSXX-COOH protein n=1 Tax=Saccharothrix ecbatanensis TaxID=1105145 RepID=A0A7W9LZF5_9PSEU|nr:hypothetical protein [Saccharothrix ecbatanensis]MBB5801642.1 hypothetical protein [Saccharothrix ecbatanensis]